MDHSGECWAGKDPGCLAGTVLHSEHEDEHWWSGWPGAYCMKCGSGDPQELCLADGCRCKCHPPEIRGEA